MDPLKETAWDFRSPLSPSATIPTDLYSLKLWGLLFLTLEPWAGGPCVGLGALTPQGGICSQDIPPGLSSKKTITNSLVHSLQVFSIEILSYIMYKYVYVRGIVCKIDLWLFRKILMR